MDTNNQLVLYNSKSGLVFVCLYFVITGSIALLIGILGEFMGLVVFLISLIGLFIIIPKFFEKEPHLIIDEKGITDFRWEYGLIPWEDIEAVWIALPRRTRSIAIRFRNPERYLQQMSSFQRLTGRIVEGHFALNSGHLNASLSDVWDHIAMLKSTGQISVSMEK